MITYLAVAVFGALVFRIRGGGFIKLPSTFMARMVYVLAATAVAWAFMAPPRLATVEAIAGALFNGRASAIPASLLAFSAQIVSGWFLFSFAVATYATILIGWAEWFTAGRSETTYQDSIRFWPIDWVLWRTWGPLWRPAYPQVHPDDERGPADPHRFDVVTSPTGDPRPYWWRAGRDTTGMSLRGLIITVPLGFLIWFPLGHGAAFCFAGALMGPAYWIGSRLPSLGPALRQGPDIGEAIWGALFFVLLAAAVR